MECGRGDAVGTGAGALEYIDTMAVAALRTPRGRGTIDVGAVMAIAVTVQWSGEDRAMGGEGS